MAKERKPNGYWTKERVFEESKKYSSRYKFFQGNRVAYGIAAVNNWLEDMTWLPTPTIKPNKYWTRERVFEESKKYKGRNEFQKESNRAYHVAREKGWLDEMTWLKNYKDLDKDQVDCVYIYKFEEQHTIYVGRTVEKKRRAWSHENRTDDSVYKFLTENSLKCPEMEVIEDNLTLREGQEREAYWIEYYKSEGWTLLNKAKAGSLGSIGAGKWYYESCKEEASKYRTRSEFPF